MRSGGSVTSTTVSSGGQLYVSSGCVDSASTMQTYGHEFVYHGGTTYSDVVAATGATQVDLGLTVSTTVLHGGVENVSAGGVESSTQLYGAEHLLSGGKGYNELVYRGGQLYVSSGGVDSGAILSSGGIGVVYSGGVIRGATVIGGATLTVSSGGFASGGLTLSGGTAKISGSTANPMSFSGAGGDLALYNLAGFALTIGGFAAGDEIDLGGFVYSAGEGKTFVENAGHIQGLLTITDGAQVAKLTLLGNYTSSDFVVANDLHGGTFVKFV